MVTDATLKVMTESDYFAIRQNKTTAVQEGYAQRNTPVRDVIVPQIQEDVNNGENFSKLRQMYNSIILANWFKSKLRDSIYKHYINKSKVNGLEVVDKTTKDRIYNLYVEAFKKGVYDYTRKERDVITGKKIKRKYFSGGFELDPNKAAGSSITSDVNKVKFIGNAFIASTKNSTSSSILTVGDKSQLERYDNSLNFESYDQSVKQMISGGKAFALYDYLLNGAYVTPQYSVNDPVFLLMSKTISELLKGNDNVAKSIMSKVTRNSQRDSLKIARSLVEALEQVVLENSESQQSSSSIIEDIQIVKGEFESFLRSTSVADDDVDFVVGMIDKESILIFKDLFILNKEAFIGEFVKKENGLILIKKMKLQGFVNGIVDESKNIFTAYLEKVKETLYGLEKDEDGLIVGYHSLFMDVVKIVVSGQVPLFFPKLGTDGKPTIMVISDQRKNPEDVFHLKDQMQQTIVCIEFHSGRYTKES